MRHALRPYQSKAIDSLRAEIAAGRRRVVLVAPTGSGKTTCAAAIIESATAKGRRSLFIAHRTELIDQASARLDSVGVDHGIMQADHPRRRPDAPVQVASVQTLIRREPPPADVVIVDEAHRALGESYTRTLAAYPGAVVIGLTATPWRTDGRGLRSVFAGIVVVAQPADLVPEYIMAPRIFAPTRPDLSRARVSRGDYDPGSLEAIMGQATLIGDTVDHWRRLADGRRTLVFACTVRHSVALRDRFRGAGVEAEHIDAMTPATERAAILARLRAGDVRVVCNVGIATEGYDLPELGCVTLARPTQSSVLYLQQVGRVMRQAPGKPAPLVLDHADCVRQHGHPLAEREYTLDDIQRLERGQAKPRELVVRICPGCLGVCMAAARVCEHCGASLVGVRDTAEEHDGELVEVVAKPARATLSIKRDEYARLDAIRRARGYKPGWTAHQYRSRFGVWPRGVRSNG